MVKAKVLTQKVPLPVPKNIDAGTAFSMKYCNPFIFQERK
jgi:hypothetical protein